MKLTVAQLAERIGAELAGDGGGQITAVSAVEAAGENNVTFLTNDRHLPRLKKSRAGAVIVGRRIEGVAKPQLIVKNVDAALIEALKIFAPKLRAATKGIDPTAKVGQNVKIAKDASIGANVVIEDGAEIGENSILTAGCKVGENTKIGKNCRLDGNVVVYHNCAIGNNVIIQANSTVGSTGFGYSFIDGSHRLIPHNGGVVLEDFVEIGANCCVDRAKFGNTVIGAGTKIDNLVQIAHNVVIGKCCLIVAQAAIAGSSRIGDGVVLAGRAGVSDNIEMGDGAMAGGGSVILEDVAAGKKMFGYPAIEKTEALRVFGLTKRLPKMAESLKQLHKRIEKLESAEDDKK
ncbi:MAG: UDP-3-O-(3-hydroxymyristoyl)glucosamine N-acyltransferase [Sedimentisphaerales bacterium]|nr:UDP-3-O-(3-hydroxymyristoyl)glucosamine N-acyltransferase [Sedimentisphaerales bacterium]